MASSPERMSRARVTHALGPVRETSRMRDLHAVWGEHGTAAFVTLGSDARRACLCNDHIHVEGRASDPWCDALHRDAVCDVWARGRGGGDYLPLGPADPTVYGAGGAPAVVLRLRERPSPELVSRLAAFEPGRVVFAAATPELRGDERERLLVERLAELRAMAEALLDQPGVDSRSLRLEARAAWKPVLELQGRNIARRSGQAGTRRLIARLAEASTIRTAWWAALTGTFTRTGRLRDYDRLDRAIATAPRTYRELVAAPTVRVGTHDDHAFLAEGAWAGCPVGYAKGARGRVSFLTFEEGLQRERRLGVLRCTGARILDAASARDAFREAVRR